MNFKSLFVETVSLLFIALFVYAATSKLTDPTQFAIQINQSPLLQSFSWIVVWTVPAIEIILACLLAIAKLRLVGLFGAFVLMVIFTAYIIAILQFSEHIPCSCGGILETLDWRDHLIFNIAFVILAILAIFASPVRSKKLMDSKI